MTYGRRLLLTLLCAQLPLIVGVVLPLIGGVALFAVLGGGVSYPTVKFRAFLSAQTYAYGLITVLVYGAPIYAFLAQRGRANWITAAALGVGPGVAALLIGIYPSGRLADANVTIGPIVMACGVFVALGTHALAREVMTSTDQAVRQVMRGSALPLARVFVLGAILGGAWGFMLVVNTPAGYGFAALGFLDGAGRYVIPLLLLALACALYSYFTTPKPRGIAQVFEMAFYLAIGIVLLIPAAAVLLL